MAINITKDPVSSERIEEMLEIANERWKKSSEKLGQAALMVGVAILIVSFVNTSALAILFFAVVASVIAAKFRMQWLTVVFVAFFGLSIYYDGHSAVYSGSASAACLILSVLMVKWIMAAKQKISSIKGELEGLKYVGEDHLIAASNEDSLTYLKKISELGRPVTNGEASTILEKEGESPVEEKV